MPPSLCCCFLKLDGATNALFDRSNRTGSAVCDLAGDGKIAAAISADSRYCDGAAIITLCEFCLTAVGVEVPNHHILIGQRLGIMILNAKVPHLDGSRIPRVKRNRVKGLRDDRFFHCGISVPEDILHRFRTPIHFGGAFLYPFADRTPHGSIFGPRIQVCDQKLTGNGLAFGSVESNISHLYHLVNHFHKNLVIFITVFVHSKD
nr:MAG TPA: hypothetical protein [Caudoviricetes sp.]